MTPDEYTIEEIYLSVGDGHELYVQDWGNPSTKKPILFLHGGPGMGCSDHYKKQFDGTKQRIIFFDQRGSGKSRPFGSLKDNTTQHLVDDIKKILNHLELESVVITGNSWGACLALAFGIEYPEMVSEMILKGIFTGSQAEIDWINQGHFAPFYPDVWDRYLDMTPAKYHNDPTAYHFERALGKNGAAAKQSAYAFSCLEGALLSLDDRFTPYPFETFDPDFGTNIEMHYLSNRCFMPDRYILENAHKLSMPVWLVQGRYDMVCPPATAYELAAKIPDCQLVWTVSGHSSERSVYDVARVLLLQATGEK